MITRTRVKKIGVDNPYRYSTKEWDEKSGLYYFGARYYSPEIGRWTQRDTAAVFDRSDRMRRI
jgi:RHS repeat-associated protein